MLKQIVDFTNCQPWNNSNFLERIYSFICTNVSAFPRHTIAKKYVHFKDYNQDICLITNIHHFKGSRLWCVSKVLDSF